MKAEQGKIPPEEGRTYGVAFNEPIFVVIQAQPTRGIEVERLLKGVSIRITGRTKDVLEAEVPIRTLELLSQHTSILSIDRSVKADIITLDDDVVNDIKAGVWMNNGYTGSGVKIGIIDGGFGTYLAPGRGLTSPTTEQMSCSTTPINNSTDHGSMVAEVIKSMAPNSELYLANVVGRSELAGVVECMHEKGVKIINMSLAFNYSVVEGPGNGSGLIGGSLHAVDLASSLGITFITGSGNYGDKHWSGSWTDTDQDSWLNFQDTSGQPQGEYIHWRTPLSSNSYANVALRWRHLGTDGQAEWDVPCTNFDLYLHDAFPGTSPIAKSEDIQACVGPSPTRALELLPARLAPPGSSWYISVKWISGPTENLVLDVIDGTSSLASFDPTQAIAAGSLTHPADTSAGSSVVVGSLLKTPPNTIASYSASGPTTDNRARPDVVTLTGLDVVGGPFLGTSASTPVVTSGAALLLESQPSMTASQLATILRNSTVPVSGPEPFRVGNGRFSLSTPPGSLLYNVFVGTSGSGLIARSDQPGADTWLQLNTGHDLAQVRVVLAPAQPANVVYIYGTTAGSPAIRKAYRSGDSGVTWTQIADSPGSTNLISIRPDADVMYALSGGVVYKSIAGGSWAATLLGAYTNPQNPWCWYRGYTHSVTAFALPKSSGSQRIWFLRGPSPNSDGSNCDHKLHYTDDEGATWFGGFGGFGSGAGQNLFASADQGRAYMGYGAGSLYGFDLTSPTSASSFAVSGPTYAALGSYVSNTKDHVLIAFQNYGMYVSENGGASMTTSGIGQPAAGFTFDPGSPQNWWWASGGSVAYSSDNGYTWTTASTGYSGALSLAVR